MSLPASTPLRIENLSIAFGGLKAVQDVSFNVGSRELVSLIGPNGAGKTTVFNMVTGFLRPQAGRVLVGGEDITGAEPHVVARKGMVRTFQITNVFQALSVRENVAYANFLSCGGSPFASVLLPGRRRKMREQQEARASEILSLVGLSERGEAVASSLSYGELRLLEIAIALAADPSILLLDEPAAGLNNSESARLRELLRRLVKQEGLALLLVEHDMSVVMEISDRIVVINFGRKIAEGTPAEIMQSAAVKEAYLGDIDSLLTARKKRKGADAAVA